MDEIAIDDVIVPVRFRRDMGDLDLLAASIKEVGLLQPIVVDEKNILLCGQRRLLATKRLGWTKIACYVVSNLTDAIPRMIAERDENTCRKEFSPLELHALAKAFAEIERPKAAERAQAGKFAGAAKRRGKHHELDSSSCTEQGSTAEKVAAAIGVGQTRIWEIAKVVEAAENDPEQFAPVLEEMERTGKVNRAFLKVNPPLSKNGAFDLNEAKKRAESKIRIALRSWPEHTRKHIPTFLRQLAKENW